MILKKDAIFRVTTCDFNNYEQIVPYGVLNIFQDIAAYHAEECGVGFQAMLAQDVIWILAKIKYEIIEQPKRFELVTVTTWPRLARHFEAEREYVMMGESHEILIKATSKWCLFDMKTKRLTLADRAHFNGEFSDVKNFPDGAFATIPFAMEKAQYVFTYIVTPSDIDRNQHMNNAKYGLLVYDAIALGEHDEIHDVQIDYVAQAYLKEKINVYLAKNNAQESIVYGLKDDNQLVFKALVHLK